MIGNHIKRGFSRLFLFAAIAALTLTSCSDITKMSVGKPEFENIQMTSFTGALVTLGMPVSNPTAKNLEITSIEGSVIHNDVEIAQFTLNSPIEIPAGFKGKVSMPLNTKLTSLTAASDIIQSISSGDASLSSLMSSSTIPATISYNLGSRSKSKHLNNLLKFAK